MHGSQFYPSTSGKRQVIIVNFDPQITENIHMNKCSKHPFNKLFLSSIYINMATARLR